MMKYLARTYVGPLILVAAILVVGLIWQPSKAKAALPNLWPSGIPGNDPSPSSMPSSLGIYNYLNTCRNQPNSPAFGQWVSLAGSPAATSTTVAYGTKSISLDFSFNGATCHYSSGSVYRTNLEIENASAGVSGIVGLQSLSFIPGPTGLVFGSGSPEGTYRLARKSFTYSPGPNGFVKSGKYTIGLSTKVINQFPGPKYLCVNPPSVAVTSTTSIVNFAPCTLTPNNFTIQVNVQSAPGFTATAQANAVTLKPGGDAPTSADFSAQINMTVHNPPGFVKGLTVTRTYCIEAYPSNKCTTNLYTTSSPPSGDTIFAPNRSYPRTGQAVSGLNPGDKVCQIITVSPSSGKVDSGGNIISGTGTSPDTSCATVSAMPYMSMYGGDVFAGGALDIGSTCGPVNNSANIYAFLTGTSQGAGSQFAAYATGTIAKTGNYGFASAKLRDIPTTAPNPPDELDMGSTSGTLGGFTGFCNDHYHFNPIGSNLSGPVSVPTTSGAYQALGGLTVNGSNLPNGTHVIIYVKGDLTIEGNISYQSPGSWTSPTDIPSLVFIVQGNINISYAPGKQVTNLDGIYIAEQAPTSPPTKGSIYTCTSGAALYPISQLYNNCRTQLVVHGRLLANAIFWLRTYGTRDKGSTDNSYNPYTQPGSLNSAEVIISGPEDYIGLPAISNPGKLESITGLPPVL